MLVNRRRRRVEPLLFPGWQLQQRVRSNKVISTLTGEVFEALTSAAMQGERRTTNSTASLCPDLIDERARVMVESKAASGRTRFKIETYQVDQYLKAAADGWRVVYALWSYHARRLRATYRTVGKIVEAITQSVTYCDLLDVRILKAICERAEAGALPGVGWRRYWNAAEAEELGGDWPFVNISRSFLERLRGDPDRVLFRELGLAASEFEYSAQGTLRAECTYDGVAFPTGNFVTWQIVRRSAAVPF